MCKILLSFFALSVNGKFGFPGDTQNLTAGPFVQSPSDLIRPALLSPLLVCNLAFLQKQSRSCRFLFICVLSVCIITKNHVWSDWLTVYYTAELTQCPWTCRQIAVGAGFIAHAAISFAAARNANDVEMVMMQQDAAESV